MPKHIGIVACSAEGAALCYRTICLEAAEFLGRHAHPEVSLHTPNFADYERALERGDIERVSELMLSSATKLAAAGAEFLICPDNTIHQAFPLLAAQSPLPWLHIAEVVAGAASEHGFRRLGLLGTRWLVESNVYPEKLAQRGLECIRPGADDIQAVDSIILDELVCGLRRSESLARLQEAVANLASQGCEAVILGCTELPLLLEDANSPLPVLDSTRLLARAALRFAIAERTASDAVASRNDTLAEARRLQRLTCLPTSLPLGGIITPV